MGGIDAWQVPECVLDTALRGLYWYTIAYLDHDNEMPDVYVQRIFQLLSMWSETV